MILALRLGEIVLAHPYLFFNLGTVPAAPPLFLLQDSMILVFGLGENVLALISLSTPSGSGTTPLYSKGSPDRLIPLSPGAADVYLSRRSWSQPSSLLRASTPFLWITTLTTPIYTIYLPGGPWTLLPRHRRLWPSVIHLGLMVRRPSISTIRKRGVH